MFPVRMAIIRELYRQLLDVKQNVNSKENTFFYGNAALIKL